MLAPATHRPHPHAINAIKVFVVVAGLAACASPPSLGQTPAPGPFDLVGARRDVNGLLLNPSWGDSSGRPGSLDPVARCGMLALHGTPGYRQVLLRDTTCLILQRGLLRLSEPRSVRLAGVLCGQAAEGGAVHGHINWFPVTMTGVLRYMGSLKGTGGDYDFTFDLLSAASWPVTRWNTADSVLRAIHLEFDFRETTDRLLSGQGAWWSRFAGMARDTSLGAPSAERIDSLLLGPRRATATGLFNLDAVHKGHAELHPVYALAVLVREDTVSPQELHQQWALLARDRGNEGNCATGIMPLRLGADSDRLNEYRIVIEGPGGESGAPRINRRASWIGATNVGVTGPRFFWAPGQGLEIAVGWPKPLRGSPDALVLGLLDLTWQGQFRGPPSLSFMGLPSGEYKGRPSRGIAQDARQRALADLGPRGEEAREVMQGRSRPHPVKASARRSSFDTLTATGVRERNNWSDSVTILGSLPRADSLPSAPVEIFEVESAVFSCHEVSKTVNPRCIGVRSISPLVAMRIRDWGRDRRKLDFALSLGLEGPFLPGPLDFLGDLLHLRPAIGYARRRPLEDSVQVRALHRAFLQLGVMAGPVTNSGGFYLVAYPEVGWNYEGAWGRASLGSSVGLGNRPRNGYRIDFAVEGLYWFGKHSRPYVALALKVPVVVPF